MALWDHQQATALGDQIVVSEDHGGALVTVVENLRFHAVEAKADGDLHRLCGGLQNVLQMFLDQLLNGQGGDIAGAANGHRNAPDTTAIGIGEVSGFPAIMVGGPDFFAFEPILQN